MNILVICANGLSSNLFVRRLREEAEKQGRDDLKFGACSVDRAENYLDKSDVILIAPQAAFLQTTIENKLLRHQRLYVVNQDKYLYSDCEKDIFNLLDQEEEYLEETANHLEKVGSGQRLRLKAKRILDRILRMANNRYMRSVQGAFVAMIPISLVGSLATLAGVFFSTFTGTAAWVDTILQLLDLIYHYTIDLFALYFIVFFTRRLNSGGKGVIGKIAVNIIAFVCLTGIRAVDTGNYGVQGIFTAIFAVIVSDRIYIFWDRKFARRKTAAPIVLLGLVFMMNQCIAWLTPYDSLNTWIDGTLQYWLKGFIGDNIITYVFQQFIINVLWFFGLHGARIVGTVTTPVYEALALENLALYRAGSQPVYIVSSALMRCYISGGAGSLLSLVLIMTLFAKSKRYRSLGKISLLPTFFSINESVFFGLPVVMNPLFMIPMLFITPALALLTYMVMKIGLIPIPSGASIPFICPPVLYGLLQGSWKISVWEIICSILSGICWYPFFRVADNLAYQKEQTKQE